MRRRERHALGDRRVEQQNLVNLPRRNLLAATVDHFLQPPGDEDVAVLIEVPLIAGPEPAVDESAGVGVGVGGVARRHALAADRDLPGGSGAQGRTGESGFTGGPAVTLPYALFPTAAQIPGCVATATSCSVGGTTGINGIQLNGGNGNLVPQKGKAWSIGVDLAPVQVPGLRIAVTYWHNELRGGITAPQIALVTNSAALSQYLTVYPTGATAAQIGALTATLPQTGTVLAPTYFIYSNQQQNVLNLNVSGIDLDASYRFETENMGKFTLTAGFSRKTQFDQFFGAAGQTFSVLGVAGYNLTFPSLKYEGRYSVGWDYKGIDANIFVNHTGSYINWGNPANARINTAGLPTGGGDVVKAFVTVDAHFGYTFKDTGPFKSLQLYVDANNLFDAAPPFYNTFTLNGAVGYDGTNANPIGRVVTLGIRTKF